MEGQAPASVTPAPDGPSLVQGPRGAAARVRSRAAPGVTRIAAAGQVGALLLCAALGLGLTGCRSGTPSVEELAQAIASAEADAARRGGTEPGLTLVRPDAYRGPSVAAGKEGTARFARTLWRAFRPETAMGTVERLDQSYRAAASPEFDQALDHLAATLEAGGFRAGGAEFELRWLTSDDPVPGWTPKRARLDLHTADGSVTLHAFDDAADHERVMLPIHAPSARVRGPVALALDAVTEGSIFVTEAPARQVLARAEAAGAIAVVSASLGTYNVDPTGAERHLDAVQYRKLPEGTTLPVAQISPRNHAAICAAVEQAGAREGLPAVQLALDAEVEVFERPLRTLVAIVHGSVYRDRAVAISAHLNEPGAGDNGSGVATLLEGALNLVESIRAQRLERPRASVAFVFGDEFRQSHMFLDQSGVRVLAGFSADMTGQSYERTGAIALLERGPDPGARLCLAPDEHSSWGQSEVRDEMILPTGLAVIARCAMVDVGLLEEREAGRPWPSADHPWEGGSDHDVFLERGIPAVLFWHFTDFTYHTSLDVPGMVDPEEMRRTGAALLSAALGVADARPADLSRYAESLRAEVDLRAKAAAAAGDKQIEEAWRDWGTAARSWLRVLCLDLEVDEARDILGTVDTPPRDPAAGDSR